jgi:hypothetical protein
MSKRTRTLILGATLAAMNLAGLTAVAHAQANHDPDGKDARRPPSERQVGEVWRKRPPVTSQPTTMDAAVRQLLRERSSQDQTTTDPAAQRALARQRYWYYQSTLAARQAHARRQPPLESRVGEQYRTPSNAPVQPAEPSSEPNRPIALVGLLAAALALVGALVAMTASRAGRKARVRQAV